LTKNNSDKASWLRPIPEELTKNNITSKKRAILSLLTLLVLGGFGGLIWMSYTTEPSNMGLVPVVRAANSAIKVKPLEPGGKEIRFQDMEVFDTVDNIPREEDNVIASSAEIPLKRPAFKSKVFKEEPLKNVDIPTKNKNIVSGSTLNIQPLKINSGDYMIQIGAFRERNKAEEFWAEAKKKNDIDLAGLSPTYMRMDMGAKGVLYRVRGGMITSRQEADNVCASLVKKKQVCMVVLK